MQARVRQLEARQLELHLVVEEQVEVDRPRAVARPALAAELLLDLEQPVEEHDRGELRLDGGDAVQEARLVDDADRLRLAQRGEGGEPHLRRLRDELDGAVDRGLRVADVGAEADVGAAHRLRSTEAAVHATGTPNATSGLRTRTLTRRTGKRARSASATAAASASSRLKRRPSEIPRMSATTSE